MPIDAAVFARVSRYMKTNKGGRVYLVVLGQALVRKGMNAACTAIHIVSHFEPMLEVLI